MVRTFQITKALEKMPVIDNMLLAAPNQPGEQLRNASSAPRAMRRREREIAEQAGELLEQFNLTKLRDSLRRHALRAASASCSSWRGP